MDQLINRYMKLSPEIFKKRLMKVNKKALVNRLEEILTLYATDKNSSTLREKFSVETCGFTHSNLKLGHDGYKIDSKLNEIVDVCEAKPKNISSISKSNQKLDGSGVFSDFTPERLERYKKEQPKMIVSGFIDGKPMYVVEFPFHRIQKKLKKALDKRFPLKIGRKKNEYLRSARFGYRDWGDKKKNKDIKLKFKSREFKQHKHRFTKAMFNFLESYD